MSQPQPETQKPRKEKFTAWYRITRVVSRLVFNTLLPVRYHGLENIDLDAPYLLIANHNSMLDPLIVGWKIKRYQIRFLGKRELTKNPLARSYFKGMRMISVGRGESDLAAMRACFKVLKEGHVLGVFPEGTRHKQGVMQDLEDGTGMIALRANVPLLPAYITGKARFFHRLEVYYDQPMRLDDLVSQGMSKEHCDEAMDRIRQRYAELVAAHPFAGEKD